MLSNKKNYLHTSTKIRASYDYTSFPKQLSSFTISIGLVLGKHVFTIHSLHLANADEFFLYLTILTGDRKITALDLLVINLTPFFRSLQL